MHRTGRGQDAATRFLAPYGNVGIGLAVAPIRQITWRGNKKAQHPG